MSTERTHQPGAASAPQRGARANPFFPVDNAFMHTQWDVLQKPKSERGLPAFSICTVPQTRQLDPTLSSLGIQAGESKEEVTMA